MTPNEIKELDALAIEFTQENFTNPTTSDYLVIRLAMMQAVSVIVKNLEPS